MLLKNITNQIQRTSLFHELLFFSECFFKSQIIPSFNKFEIKPCLLINEPKTLIQASKGYNTEIWMRLDVS